ncbi:putative RNA-directed DNA polymerase [Helianthus annuus]|nr:putative RNA-directed DNA polymerase [Helianthus annuus]
MIKIKNKQLWEDLLGLMRSLSGSWIFLGDFNCVREPTERKNSRFLKQQADDFNSFINEAGLAEYSMLGCDFTFVTDDGAKFSKIDRVLVCHSFLSMWPSAKLLGLPRYKSDHRPLLLLCSDVFFGKPPFRFFNSWLKEDGLAEIVKKAYDDVTCFYPPDKSLAAKLKAIKVAIKPWCEKIKNRESKLLKELQKKVDNMDLKAESVALTEQEVCERDSWLKMINELDDNRLEDLKQRAKVKWAVDGDENSAFFHGVINGHRKHNRINGLNFDGVWISQPEELKANIKRYFESIFTEQAVTRPKFSNNGFKVLSTPQTAMLVKRFSKEEIKEAVWSCGGDKSPGPDGFTFKFIKKFWELFEKDFESALDYFYVHGKLNRGCNSSFISLVPKTNNPQKINNFRPISLIGCISKVVSKILSSRLKKVMDFLISDVQTAYIEGRSILEGPLIINELISWAKSSKKKMMLFKVDFEKAFDSLSWEFLDSTLAQMGFPALWRKWVLGILKSARTSVLVNGAPTLEFETQRGVRQGDPLSPLLFILAMEALHVATKSAVELGIFKGITTPGAGPSVSHLLYADDALFVGEWSEDNFHNLARLLRCFHLSSGLKVNFSKSKVFGVGVGNEEVTNMASILGCERGSLPFTYLGLLVGSNMGLVKNWKPVIDRFESKLSLWKARTLSFGGRTTLVKAVLGKGSNSNLTLSEVQNRLEVKLGCGNKTFFWLDNWVGNYSLRERFPSLFALQNDRSCLVQQRYIVTNGLIEWTWGGESSGIQSDSISLWEDCVKILEQVKIENKSDMWLWKQEEKPEIFKVCDLRSELDGINLIPETQVLKWLNWIPKKINCFLWRAVLDRIPTRVSLALRNIHLPSVLCALCNSASESVDHLLISCQYAQLVWTAVSLWVKIPLPRYLLSLVGLMEHIESQCSSQEIKKAVYLIAAATCWILWRIRNNLIFNGKITQVSRAVGDIKAISFFWVKARAGKTDLDWKKWSEFRCFK